MTRRILLAVLSCGVAALGGIGLRAGEKPNIAAGAGAPMPSGLAVARDGKRAFAPRGADAGVSGVFSYFQPAAGPKFVPFKRTSRPTFQDAVQLLFLSRSHPVRVELRMTGTTGTLAERWETNLKNLFAAFDRDGDGFLNRYEAERIFSKTEFRQMVQGGYAFRGQGQGTVPTLDALDRDGDGWVGFEEFADYYEADVAALLRPRLMAVPNYNQQADAITPELFARFDADGDGKLTEQELKNAERLILALDADEDECVTAAEILASPVLKKLAGVGGGAMPTMPAMPGMPGPDGRPTAGTPDFQSHLGTLPGSVVQQVVKKYDRNNDFELTRDEIGFDKAAFDRLDKNKDGKLTATELDVWRSGPADLVATLIVGTDTAESSITVTPEKGIPTVVVATDGGRAILLVGTQTVELAPYRVPEYSRQQRANPYAYVFPAGKEFLTEADLSGPQNQFLRVLFEPADFDSDGKLTRAEFDRYFALQRATGELGMTVGHATRVPNLFQLIDQNGDGKLSARELRTAYSRLIPMEPTGGKAVTRAILQPSVALRAGPTQTANYDQTLYGQAANPNAVVAPTKGPLWFRKMDRNGDGDVSRAEFLGTKEQFDAIDLDKDGLITLAEAEAFDKKARPGETK